MYTNFLNRKIVNGEYSKSEKKEWDRNIFRELK